MNPRFLATRRAPRAELLEPLSDEELAELIGQGHEEAFEALVTRHRRGLVNQCSALVGRADAEEAVQETLLRAYLSLSRGQSVQRVGAWLRTIAHNTALNLLRSRAARPVAAEHEPSDVATDPFERREHLRLVLEALGSLPKRQREALVMRELEGRSYAEIESRLRTSNGAVRQLLNRARARIRTRLSGLAGFEPALRWIVGSGSPGSSALRLGALGGGCAVTVKLCAGALLPLALAPAPLTRPEAARPAQHFHAHAAAAHAMGAAINQTLASAVAAGDPLISAHDGTVYVAYHLLATRGRSTPERRVRHPTYGGPAGSGSGPGQQAGPSGGGRASSTSAVGQTGGTSNAGQPWGGGGRSSGGGADNYQRQDAPRAYAASDQGSAGSRGDQSASSGSGSSGTGGSSNDESASPPTFASSQWSATSSAGGSPGNSRPDEGALDSSGAPEGLSSTAP